LHPSRVRVSGLEQYSFNENVLHSLEIFVLGSKQVAKRHLVSPTVQCENSSCLPASIGVAKVNKSAVKSFIIESLVSLPLITNLYYDFDNWSLLYAHQF
jgi:hypothetical protein